MEQPKISVITIVYNDVTHIKATIDSVFKQTYPYIEYILIDGESTDGTYELIESTLRQIASVSQLVTAEYPPQSSILKFDDFSDTPPSIKYDIPSLYLQGVSKNNPHFTFKFLSQKDDGIYDAMNKGIDLASGRWCNFMNCGDRFSQVDVIEQFFSLYRKHLNTKRSAEILYGDASIIYSSTDSKILYSKTTKHKYHHHFIHQSAFIESSLMKRYKYDTRFKIAGDTDFFTKAYNNGVEFLHIPLVVACFNVEGVSSSLSWRMFKEDCTIGYKYNRLYPVFYVLRYVFYIVPRVCVRKLIPRRFQNKARVLFGKKYT